MFNWLQRLKERKADDRGAAAILSVIFLAAILPPLLALTVDVGMQRAAVRDMQSVADMVAIDLARRLDGRTEEQLKPTLDSALERSVSRNSQNLGGTPIVTYRLGSLDNNGTFINGTSPPTAVEVTSDTNMELFFNLNDSSLKRTAVAVSSSHSCIKLGTYVIGFNGSGSPVLKPILEGLLGSNTNVTAVGYEGLSNVTITMDELAAQLGLGSTQSLLTTQVSVAQILDASISVLEQNGAAASQIEVLRRMRLSPGAALNRSVEIGKFFSTELGNSSALYTSVDVLSLIYASLIVASPETGISIPALNTGPLSATLVLSAPPQIGCNSTNAVTSAVRLELAGNTNVNLQGFLGIARAQLKFDVQFAYAKGKISNNGCLQPAPGATTINILEHQVARIVPTINIVIVSGLVDVKVNMDTATGNAIVNSTTIPNGPYNDKGLTEPKSLGGGNLSLNSLSDSNVELELLGNPALSKLLDGVAPALVSGLNPIIVNVNNLVNNTVGPLLGTTVAGLDAYGVERPMCHLSALKS